jgi:hypothetical protein
VSVTVPAGGPANLGELPAPGVAALVGHQLDAGRCSGPILNFLTTFQYLGLNFVSTSHYLGIDSSRTFSQLPLNFSHL